MLLYNFNTNKRATSILQVNVEQLGCIVVGSQHGLVSQPDLSSSTYIVRGNVFRKQGVALLGVTSRHRCHASHVALYAANPPLFRR